LEERDTVTHLLHDIFTHYGPELNNREYSGMVSLLLRGREFIKRIDLLNGLLNTVFQSKHHTLNAIDSLQILEKFCDGYLRLGRYDIYIETLMMQRAIIRSFDSLEIKNKYLINLK